MRARYNLFYIKSIRVLTIPVRALIAFGFTNLTWDSRDANYDEYARWATNKNESISGLFIRRAIGRPFTFAGRKYNVHDISERGIAFETENACCYRLGERLLGSLRFPDGKVFNCRGVIVRKRKDFVAIHLAIGIPLSKIRFRTNCSNRS